LIDLTVEDLTSDERILMTSVLFVLLWHHGDVVDENLQFVMIEILNEFIIVVFKFLKAVIVIEQLVNGAVFATE